MKQRCQNPNHRNYHRYGGRGISVCEQWQDFEGFLAGMGTRPSREVSLDRIDPDGDYEPGNCRWANQKEQCNNWPRRFQFIVNYQGEDFTLQELADRFGLDRYTLRCRIVRGRWPEEFWHLPPDPGFRPNRLMDDAELASKAFPRGRV